MFGTKPEGSGYAQVKDTGEGSRTPFLPTTRTGLWHDSDEDDTPLARAFPGRRRASPLSSPISPPRLSFPPHGVLRTLRGQAIAALCALVLLGLCATVLDAEAYWDGYLARRVTYAEVLEEAALSKGWRLFEANTPKEVSQVEAVASEGLMSPACLDQWIAEGVYCDEAKGAFEGTDRLDVVYLWTNGTDALTSKWRDAIGPRLNKLTARHFREHDELRYSIRSLFEAFSPESFSKITLITADFPLDQLPPRSVDEALARPSTIARATHLGQTPHWLNHSSSSPASLPANYPPLVLQHHSNVFTDASQLPTFNSLPIEASLPTVPGLEAHGALYSNDDFFYGLRGGRLSTADRFSPLLGPVFELQRNFLFKPHAPWEATEGESEGEWPGIGRAVWLLNNRFGERRRTYLHHVPKSMPRALTREVGIHFRDALRVTAASRFRGTALEYQPFTLIYHYVVEKHREALLWSFLVARSDANHDGRLNATEARAMLSQLGLASPGSAVEGFIPRRSTLASLEGVLDNAGLPRPLSTKYEFASADGYPMAGADGGDAKQRLWPIVPLDEGEEADAARDSKAGWRAEPVCVLAREVCFPEGFGEDGKGFDVSQSGGRGLSAFLPPPDATHLATTPTALPPLDLLGLAVENFADVDFAPPASLIPHLRQHTIRLLNRYSYTIGSSRSSFFMLFDVKGGKDQLASVNSEFARRHGGMGGREPASPSFLTINDDLSDVGKTEEMDGLLRDFFELEWPERTLYELDE